MTHPAHFPYLKRKHVHTPYFSSYHIAEIVPCLNCDVHCIWVELYHVDLDDPLDQFVAYLEIEEWP